MKRKAADWEKVSGGKLVGYKVMRYDPETGEAVSGADSRLRLPLRKGATHRMPGQGIFLAPTEKYVLDYYAEHDFNVLLKYEFDPATITFGNLEDRQPEIAVPRAKVLDFTLYDEEGRKMKARKAAYKVHMIQYPTGRFGFAGWRVPVSLVWVNKDGSELTEQQQMEVARANTPAMLAKTRSFKTIKEAVQAAKKVGIRKNEIQMPLEKKASLQQHVSRLARVARLAANTFKCPNCGTDVLEDTGYCVKCKKKVKKAALSVLRESEPIDGPITWTYEREVTDKAERKKIVAELMKLAKKDIAKLKRDGITVRDLYDDDMYGFPFVGGELYYNGKPTAVNLSDEDFNIVDDTLSKLGFQGAGM